ncbi:DUF3310 domain-containing protein [Marinobacterium stanieri]|uniref:Protein of unknwon function n=1 Tax=Marinobacterium stanieri TaxID=49186 RepID=A0A1N6QDB6_9GAMM|nr:DUF3310 domain-containing protein [Marinobacterium stanieri]SIQ14611.1 Protein of unknwon function [Marinobacterium stanieri]
MGNQVSRMDIIGQNGNDGLAYLEDVGDEQQHVGSSQTEIEAIPAIMTGVPPKGATHWYAGSNLMPQGWYKLDGTGWWFHGRYSDHWARAETVPKGEKMERLVPDHIGDTTEEVKPVRALDTQEGGNHYKSLKIQPVEYIHANGIGYFEGCVIKYVTRWRSKNGIEDLRKAQHFIHLLIELESQ